MRENRRRFIKLVSLVAGSTLIDGKVLAQEKNLKSAGLPITDDWDELRGQFPITKEKIFFNSAAGGPSPNYVVEKLYEKVKLSQIKAKEGRNPFLQKKIAEFIGAKESEIALTSNTSESINIVVWGLPLKKRDEVIITSHEHVGHAGPWLNRKKHDRIVLKVFDPKNTAEENIKAIENLITKKTKVIAIPHITCTTGLVFPIKEIGDLAKKHGILFMVDGAHSLGSYNLNLNDLNIDFFASCGHKWLLGPGGTGWLYVKEDKQAMVSPKFVGAFSDKGWILNENEQCYKSYNDGARKYFYGTQNLAIQYGFEAAIDFMNKIGIKKVHNRVKTLSNYFYNQIIDIKNIEVLSSSEEKSRHGIITFRYKELDCLKFHKIATKNKIRVRVVLEADLKAIRISTHIFNNFKDIDKLVELIKNIEDYK